jgi:hypothetical protein
MAKAKSRKKIKRIVARDKNMILAAAAEISLSTKTISSKKSYKRHEKHKGKKYD